jgi:putative ABC transport system permease protein
MENQKRKLPWMAGSLLKKFANKDNCSAILGDFQEEYNEVADSQGILRGRLWFWLLVIISFPSFIKNSLYWSWIMFRNYLKVALRNIKRHKGYSFINIAGLAIGMACSILIAIFVFYELSFDKHHEKASQIYRVGHQFGPSIDMKVAFSAPPMAQALLGDFPEIVHAARYSPWPRNYLVSTGEKKYLEKGIKYADASIFDVFSIPFTAGDPKSALSDPFTIVITEDIARKYFGDENPLGKSLRFEDRKEDYLVTGVVENCPGNSHFQFDMIASYISRQSSRDTSWMGHSLFTYIVLQDGISPSQLEAKFPNFILKHFGPQFLAQTGTRYEDYLKDEKNYYGYFLEPLLDIHLRAHTNENLSITGGIVYIYVFSIIAIFILLLACINYMNLSTARFSKRSKEVGIRKVLGSEKKQLVFQFIGESILFSCMALGLSILTVKIVLPAFSNLADRQLSFHLFDNVYVLPVLIGYALFLGVLAGSYPAFFLSTCQPARTIKGSLQTKAHGNSLLRRVLVVLQFSITVFIFIGTLVISSQLKYVQNRKLGFDKEQIVVIPRAYTLGRQADAFKQELLRNPSILSISNTESLPGRHFNPNGHRLEGTPATEEHTLYTMYADHDYLRLLNLKIVEGRYFSRDIATDATSSVVVNETAVRELGLKEPIGKRFHKEFGDAAEGEFVTIIGVLKDFHFQSLHHEILPMILRPLSEREWFYTSIKIHSENLKESLVLIEKTWRKFTGGLPFEYSFLDEDFNNLYRAEQRTAKISMIFFFLAIFIASMGLLGLVSFSAQQRTKEIGIRKVLGASVSRILYLLSREVMILVIVSAFIASPVAYLVMFSWLQNFAFRIRMTVWMFILTALAVLFMAVLSISYQAIKAAYANPADALKYE